MNGIFQPRVFKLKTGASLLSSCSAPVANELEAMTGERRSNGIRKYSSCFSLSLLELTAQLPIGFRLTKQ